MELYHIKSTFSTFKNEKSTLYLIILKYGENSKLTKDLYFELKKKRKNDKSYLLKQEDSLSSVLTRSSFNWTSVWMFLM